MKKGINTLRIALITSVLITTGCATNDNTEFVNRYKDIPVAVYGEPIEPAEINEDLKEQFHEDLPIYKLTDESSNQETILAWVQSFIIASNYAQQLEQSILPFQDLKQNDNNN